MLPGLSKVYVEVTNRCNLKCSFCPEVDRPGGELTVPGARSLFERIAPHSRHVTFHLMGEPLSHPELPALLDAAEGAGMEVTLTTNGTRLPHHGGAILRSLAVRQLNVSLQSFSDNYPGVPGGTYLRGILDFADRARVARPELWLNYRLWNLPEGVLEQKAEAAGFLAGILAHYGVPVNLRVDPGHRKGKSLGGRHRLHFDSRFRWPDPKDPDGGPVGTCQGLSTHVGVHVDGTVVPCCLDKEARIPLGNLNRDTLADILAGPRAVAMREGFARGVLTEDLCRRCTYRKRFDPKGKKARSRPST